MLTSKPISTICYLPIDICKDKLDRLLSACVIDNYYFIFHYGENGDKDHIHMLMFPSKRLDTTSLVDNFKRLYENGEVVNTVLPFRNSKIGDWIFYCLHDKGYLATHQNNNDGDGKQPYRLDDIITPYREQLKRDYNSNISLKSSNNQKIIKMLVSGVRPTEILYRENFKPSDVGLLYTLVMRDLLDSGSVNALANKNVIDNVIDNPDIKLSLKQATFNFINGELKYDD